MESYKLNVLHKDELSNTKFIVFGKTTGDAEIIEKTERDLGYPCLVRPEDPEVTFGYSTAKNVHELRQGILKAFRCSDNIIVQQIED